MKLPKPRMSRGCCKPCGAHEICLEHPYCKYNKWTDVTYRPSVCPYIKQKEGKVIEEEHG